MRKTKSAIICIVIIIGFFVFGGSIGLDSNGVPYISFEGIWENAGNAIGDAAGDLIGGIVGGFTDNLTEPAVATITPPEIPEGSDFQVHYIDVGQADAALIICDDETMLIDGGNDADGELVVAYIKSLGITELDVVVGTHAHEDHIGGLDHVLNAFTASEVWYPDYRHGIVNEKMFLEAAEEQDITVFQPDPGTTYTLGSAVCQVVGPISLDPEEPNNHSIVLRVVYGETSFLFTGDAELAEETEILDAGYDISCDVLKVGHHGSNSSTKYRWLKAADPSYAIISVGADNEYGHPTEATLSILEDAEVDVFRTDMQGHIVCISDGIDVSFIVQRNPDADTLKK